MKQHGWFVFAGGLVLVLAGAYGMWAGWDMIQLERGWAQFIAGAVAISGGVVTMALGGVINALSRASVKMAQLPLQASIQNSNQQAAPEAAPAAARSDGEKFPAMPKPREAMAASFNRSAPVEVDRYTGGDAEYVMYSDGSVEVRRAGRAQRYPSLAALRAEAASRRS